jgi:hypothetical protein
VSSSTGARGPCHDDAANYLGAPQPALPARSGTRARPLIASNEARITRWLVLVAPRGSAVCFACMSGDSESRFMRLRAGSLTAFRSHAPTEEIGPRDRPSGSVRHRVKVMRQLPERLALVSIVVALAGCGGEGGSVDPTPQKIDGTESHEFERDDIDAAAGASDAVKAYCADAVSEAQRLGCESHVTDDEIP